MDFHIIIPARYLSTRLYGKVLIEIAGKTLIQHVYERALLCGAKSVIIATDDERVEKTATAFGAQVCMTSNKHPRGTDRLAEVVQKLNFSDEDCVVNIQGDEPLVPVDALRTAAFALNQYTDACMTTLCTPIHNFAEIQDPNSVKVVLDKNGYALYFSRCPIPFNRTNDFENNKAYYRHIGLYAYRVKTLKEYAEWPEAPLEKIESLEQLRLLWQGRKIHVSVIKEPLPPGIDTEADLAWFTQYLQEKSENPVIA